MSLTTCRHCERAFADRAEFLRHRDETCGPKAERARVGKCCYCSQPLNGQPTGIDPATRFLTCATDCSQQFGSSQRHYIQRMARPTCP